MLLRVQLSKIVFEVVVVGVTTLPLLKSMVSLLLIRATLKRTTQNWYVHYVLESDRRG